VDMASYLRDLGLVVEVRPATDADLPRVAQLTQRTNQFNVSMRRRVLDDVRALTRDATVLSLSARDRHGDYGLVGVGIVAATDREGVAELDTFLLSCRALGRGVEDALLHVAAETARGHGADPLRAPWVAGPRNAPALAFLRENGFVDRDGVLERSLDRPVALPSHISLQGREPATAQRSTA